MSEQDAERIARLTQLVELQIETLQVQAREKARLLDATLLCWAPTPFGNCILPRGHEGGHQTPFAPDAEIYGGSGAHPPKPVSPELALLRKLLTPPESGPNTGYLHLDDDALFVTIDATYELTENEAALILRIRNGG